jgi:RNA-directed DNA polymerase
MDNSLLLAEFSKKLGLQLDVGYRIARTAPLRYKIFKIKKRNGGDRVIAQPAKEVKAFQRLLIDYLESKLPLHSAAMAYRKGISIRRNAEFHASASCLLKMDFSDFFPSITELSLKAHLNRYCSDWLSDADVDFICHITLWAPARQPPRRLCIGAPTSPLLSNSIMYEFDGIISDEAKKLDVVYTRYADDLTFSANSQESLKNIQLIVGKSVSEIEYPRLNINKNKTVYASKAGRRFVTGLVLTPEGAVSVGRSRKRLIRAMYHRFLLGELDAGDTEKMRGYLAYIENMEPGFEAGLHASMAKKTK